MVGLRKENNYLTQVSYTLLNHLIISNIIDSNAYSLRDVKVWSGSVPGLQNHLKNELEKKK